MGGGHGESVNAKSTSGSVVASPVALADASFAASPVSTDPSCLAVTRTVTAAVASLQDLLSVVDGLARQFRTSGDAVATSAHLLSHSDSPQQPNTSSPAAAATTTTTPSSSSSSAPLLATLDTLAGATARGDAEVGQQLTSLRRSVAALVQELHRLSDCYPTLQGNCSDGGGASAASQGRTPHATSTMMTPDSARAGSRPASVSAGGHSPFANAVGLSPGSPPQRLSVVTPTTSPQLQASSFSSSRGGGGGLGDSLRSPSSLTLSTTTPANPATRATAVPATPVATSNVPGGPAAATRLLSSPSRTPAAGASAKTPTTQPSNAASPASPSLGCLLDRVDVTHLPTAQLPCSACADSVKKYLANCVEWPPRPRRRNVRPLTPFRATVGAAWSGSDDDVEDGFHTPATAASPHKHDGGQHRSGNGDGVKAASCRTTRHRRRARSDTDDFLRRLTEESPYDLSMLRVAPHSSDTPDDDHHRHSSGDSSASSDRTVSSSASTEEEEEAEDEGRSQPHRLSASDRASSAYTGGRGLKGKRMRSRHSHERQNSSAAAPAKNLRRGRPTIVESVDALVLAQLRSDGVPLSDGMVRELRGCAPEDSSDESSVKGGGDGKVGAPPAALTTCEGETAADAEMVPMAAVPKAQRHKTTKELLWNDEDRVDIAVVLQEVRHLVRHGVAATPATPPLDLAASSKTFPSFPSAQSKQAQWRPLCAPGALHASPPSPSLTSPPQLPTTTAWLARIDDFCMWLDHLASKTSTSASTSSSSSDDGENRFNGANGEAGERATRRSCTTTTTAARKRVSRNGGSHRSARASAHSSAATLSDTATAASENDFSIADELFTSAEEAGETSERGAPPEEQHRTAVSPAEGRGEVEGEVAWSRSHPSTAHSSSLTSVPFTHSSSSHVDHNSSHPHTRVTGGSSPAFSTTTTPNALSTVTATTAVAATAGVGVVPETSPASQDLTHFTAVEDFWLERGDVDVGGGTPASDQLGIQRSSDARVRGGGGSNGDSSHAVQGAFREEAAHMSGARTSAARQHSQRHGHHHHQRERQERQRAPPQHPQGPFLRERYLYLRRLRDAETSTAHRRPSIPFHSEAETKGSNGRGSRGCAVGASQHTHTRAVHRHVPLMNYGAVARELRALCGLMRTDLTLLTTLQELSRLLTGTWGGGSGAPAATASPTWPATQATTSVGSPASAAQFSESLAAATQLLRSVQEKRSMQARIQKELKLRGVTRGEYESASVAPLSFLADGTVGRSTTMTSLLLSSQHPLSALGYAPLLAHNAHSTRGDNRKDGCGDELQESERESQLAQYLTTVTPYLFAWQTSPADVEPLTRMKRVSPPLPLPVWVYVEALTTELIEEARKLNALYERYLLLLSETSMDDMPAHGSASERLLHHVRYSGRAVSVLTGSGVTGAPLSLENGLEKFVVPVSSHLLHSFDRLESRHLLHNVLHNVHLSDVVARQRALKKQQQRLSSSSPSSSPSSRPPQRQVSTVHNQQQSQHQQHQQQGQRQSGRAAENEEAAAETVDGFALPPGTLFSSPALRSAAGVQWSMRDAEQQQQLQRGSRGASTRRPTGVRGGVNEEVEESEEDDEEAESSDTAASRSVRGGNANREDSRSASTGSELRHVIIEGFVRYLTRGVVRLRGGGRGGESGDASSNEGEVRGGGGNSPLSKATAHPTPHHHHSGLTLDVPHTSCLLKEQDERLEKATSNLRLLRAVDTDLLTQPLVEDVLGVHERLETYAGLRTAELSRRRYFTAHAAAFAASLLSSSLSAPVADGAESAEDARASRNGRADALTVTTTVVHCRWQPVFQSTMCFCPVTRRRCLDPLVCGALLVNSPLPPQQIAYSPHEHEGARPNNNNNGGSAGAASPQSGSSPLPLPASIRALRSGWPTPGPSLRRSEAAEREITVSPSPIAVFATTRTNTTSSTTATTAARTAAAAAAPARVESSMASLFPNFFLRRTVTLPERMTTPRILVQTPTILYADSSAVAGVLNEAINEEEEMEDEAEVELPELTRRVAQAAPLLLDVPPITRNLLLSPEASSQARWLNPPTLLECGHVVAHKTYLDLRTTPRRNVRVAAAPTTLVVCCPYCRKITAAKDALTLSYLF